MRVARAVRFSLIMTGLERPEGTRFGKVIAPLGCLYNIWGDKVRT